MWSRLSIAALVALSVNAVTVSAHEFWIEPEHYQVAVQEEIRARFRNGENFKGVGLPFFDRRSTLFDRVLGDERADAGARSGDNPAFAWTSPEDGLLVIAHETTPSTVSYKTWEKFAAFADHKGFPDIRARHEARGLPMDGFTESYTRHVKALVAVGTGAGQDRALGLATEFVALANPYTDSLAPGDGTGPAGSLPVLLLYQGAPRADAQIEIFERRRDDTVTISTTRTDARGQALIPLRHGAEYLLDAVVLRPAPDGGKAVWETLWAGLTFRAPDAP